MDEKFDTEFFFDPTVTYGFFSSKKNKNDKSDEKDDSFDIEKLEKIVDYIYIFDHEQDFTVKNIKSVMWPEYTFIKYLNESIFEDLKLDQVQGIILRKNNRDECAIVISSERKKEDKDEDDDPELYCFIDDDLLEKRIRSSNFKFFVNNISLLVICLLLTVSLFYLLFK